MTLLMPLRAFATKGKVPSEVVLHMDKRISEFSTWTTAPVSSAAQRQGCNRLQKKQN